MGKIKRHTKVVDAAGKSPGRLASEIAVVLMGKHRLSYEPEHDHGDRVLLKNVSQMHWTGKKLTQKVYRHHTMHPGGLKETPVKYLLQTDPPQIVRHAVATMLPKNKFRTPRLRRLRFE